MKQISDLFPVVSLRASALSARENPHTPHPSCSWRTSWVRRLTATCAILRWGYHPRTAVGRERTQNTCGGSGHRRLPLRSTWRAILSALALGDGGSVGDGDCSFVAISSRLRLPALRLVTVSYALLRLVTPNYAFKK